MADQTIIPETSVTPKVMRSQLILPSLIAAVLGGSGSFGAIEGFDLLGANANLARAEKAEALLDEALARADARVFDVTQRAEAEIVRCVQAQSAIRGQLCEYQRAAGSIREDANCWGMER